MCRCGASAWNEDPRRPRTPAPAAPRVHPARSPGRTRPRGRTPSRSVGGAHLEAGGGDQGQDLGAVETLRVVPDPPGLGDVTGQSLGQDRRVPLSHHETERSPGPEHACHGRERLRGILDHLEHLVADHEIRTGGADHLDQLRGVTLDRRHPVGQTLLGGAALQRGQRVRAGVDDPYPVADGSQLHRHAARAATQVHDVATGMVDRPRGQLRGEHVVQVRLGHGSAATQVRHFVLLRLRLTREAIRTIGVAPTGGTCCTSPIGRPGTHGGRGPSVPGPARARRRESLRRSDHHRRPGLPQVLNRNRVRTRDHATRRCRHSVEERRPGASCRDRNVVPVRRSRCGHSPQPMSNTSNVVAIGTPSRVPAGRAAPSRNSRGSKNSQPSPSM